MVVVGAGLAGLFVASELVAAGIDDLVVVERAREPGGVTLSLRRDGFVVEPAVGSLSLPHRHLTPILERAGVGVFPAAGSGARYVFSSGRLIELPASPRLLLTPVLSWPAKLRALSEPWFGRRPPPGEESLASFCRRRFGRSAGDLVGWLMASGIYAGDPERLSASAGFPTLTSLEGEHGSVLTGAMRARRARSAGHTRPRAHLPDGTMRDLAERLAASLEGRVRTGFEVGAVRRAGGGWMVEGPEMLSADAVVIAGSPAQAAQLVDDELGDHLRATTSAPVVVVALGGGGSPLPDGFGALIGKDEEMVSRGILFESSFAPARAPEGSWLMKVIVGGAPHRGIVEWETERVSERARVEAARVLGERLEPTFSEVVSHIPGIPQLEVGHQAWLRRLHELLARRAGLRLAGWGYRAVGVGGLASEASLVARDLSQGAAGSG